MEDREKAVIAAEEAWAQAHLVFNLERLGALMAPEYRRIDSQGNVLGKTETLKTYSDGPRTWLVAESTELEINFFGSAASVIGLWHGKGQNKGVHFDYRARFMAVYIERDGQWLLAAEGSIPLPVQHPPSNPQTMG